MQLRPVQALALHDAGVFGGLFGPVGVGEGKTLITFLLPLVFAARRPLLLLPASLIEKSQRDRLELSRHWRIPNTLRVFSLEMLGRVQAAEELQRRISPTRSSSTKGAQAEEPPRRGDAASREVHGRQPDDEVRGLVRNDHGQEPERLRAHPAMVPETLDLSPVDEREETEEWAQVFDEGTAYYERPSAGALPAAHRRPPGR